MLFTGLFGSQRGSHGGCSTQRSTFSCIVSSVRDFDESSKKFWHAQRKKKSVVSPHLTGQARTLQTVTARESISTRKLLLPIYNPANFPYYRNMLWVCSDFYNCERFTFPAAPRHGMNNGVQGKVSRSCPRNQPWPSCYGAWLVLLQLKDPLELFVKRRKFLPSAWVSVSIWTKLLKVTYSSSLHSFPPCHWGVRGSNLGSLDACESREVGLSRFRHRDRVSISPCMPFPISMLEHRIQGWAMPSG